MYVAYLGLGSNLGERQGNILQALQKLRAVGTVDAVSAFYETAPAGGAQGPPFLNVATRVLTTLDPEALERAVRSIEIAVGRQRSRPLLARPIDIDLLLVDGVERDFGRFELPHPYLARRAFNLVPLAEIAPDVTEPRSGRTIGALARDVDAAHVVRKVRSLHFHANRQEEEPEVKLSINRVGVSSVKRIVRLPVDGRETPFNAEFAMVADLSPERAGVHMSRFSELLEEALLEVLARRPAVARIDDVAALVAREVIASQKAIRADVRMRADFGLERWTPVSGKRGEETYTLVAIAHADETGTRRVVGVEAEGMTACPCAQLMVREHSIRELTGAGFTQADAARALDALPVATHNQRGRGAITIGVPDDRPSDIAVADLVDIVENAMSSETYDLLKRPDEFFVVNKAHHNPKFVEDVVRGIMAGALDVYADFGDDTFVCATQVNYESIHKHDAFAESFATFGELRRELAGAPYDGRKTDLATWLGTRPSPIVA